MTDPERPDSPDQPARSSIWSDLAPTLAWLGLFVLVTVTGFLAFYPPHVTFESPRDGSRSQAVCTSVAVAGWPRSDSNGVSDGVDDPGQAGYDDEVAACHARRTGAVAGMAVLSAPVSLLGCWLMVSRPRRRAQEATRAPGRPGPG